MESKIKQLIAKGENDQVEFKEAQNEIPSAVYETICAFLNHKGGDTLLGVDDNGNITGINPKAVVNMKQDFSNTINNNQKLSPPFCLSINDYVIDKKTILHIFVPEGSQVHRCKNKIYMRNNEGDYDITNHQTEVTALYLKKQNTYPENKIFPFVKIEELRADLIARARKLANIQNPEHQWKEMDDLALLKTSSLYQKNPMTGEEGFTLAAILLLGTDELIASALPGFRIDLIKRVKDIDRYDDRVDLRTNLIESYDKIMDFIAKHLPDSFYTEKEQRINLRENIFREIVANILVHKEYSGSEPTKLIIEKNKIYTENSNKPYINGIINLENLTSHPKNPNIAKFFRQLGRVEELGSGIVKLYKYCNKYTGYDPLINDEHIFKFTLPIDFYASEDDIIEQTLEIGFDQDSDQDSDQDKINNDQDKINSDQDKINSDQDKIIEFCQQTKSLQEIMDFCDYKHKTNFRNKILNPLIDKGLINLTIPDKPTSKNQKYYSVISNEVKK